MTEKEAIKILNGDINNIYDGGKIATARVLAVNALEKQIPIQPNYEADGYSDGELVYDMAYCPECNHEFEYDINDWGSNYCPDCGQRLNWRMEDGE